jgi:flagellar FliL protein
LAENNNTQENKKKDRGIKKLAVIAVLVVITLTASGFFLLQYVNPEESAEGEAAVANEDAVAEDIGPTFAVGDFTVNFNDKEQIKYLKASIVFEIDDEAVVSEMEKRKPQIRDLIITTLRSQSLEDIKEPGAKKIKTSIKAQINNTLNNGEIVSVWFTDLIIQ